MRLEFVVACVNRVSSPYFGWIMTLVFAQRPPGVCRTQVREVTCPIAVQDFRPPRWPWRLLASQEIPPQDGLRFDHASCEGCTP